MGTLERDGTILRFETEGKGPPVLLIQGVGVAGSAWQPQVEALRDRFTTVTFDNRGLGGSQPWRGPITIEAMARDALALLDHHGWASAHVVGHSMGGIIAQQLALDAPKRIRSLSLLCTFARGGQAARPTPWVLWMSLRTWVGTAAMRRRAFVSMLVPKRQLREADANGTTPALAGAIGRLVGRDLATQPPILMRQMRAMARHDAFPRLRELGHIPTQVISAEEDPIALPRFGRELAAAIPGARFEVLEHAAHGVTLTDPPRINAPVLSFLERTEAAFPGVSP